MFLYVYRSRIHFSVTRFGPPSVAPSMLRAFYWVTPLLVDPLFRCLLPIMASKKMSNKCKFEEGEKVLCYEPNPLKTKVLYDSKVNDNILPLFHVSFATFQWTVFVFIFCLGFKSGAWKRWPRTPNILQVSHPFSSECDDEHPTCLIRGFYELVFQGWNSTWDRYVTDEFILKDTEENRKLQKELAEEAQLTS